MTTTNELVSRAREWRKSALPPTPWGDGHIVNELADALELAEQKLDDIRCIPSWGGGGVGGFDVDGDEYQIIQDILRGKKLTDA